MNLKDKLSTQARFALLAGVLLAAGAGVITTESVAAREEGKAADLKVSVDDKPLNREAQPTLSFAPVVKEVTPSVVSIATETEPREMRAPRMPQMPFGLNPWFRDLFGDPDRPMMTPSQHGLGSGVVVTEDGYILTNNHVVDGADAIEVILNPGARRYRAKVVGRDPKSDIAVIKIEATGLQAIKLGDSANVEVGDVVLAIGNPFGIGQTVTMGIVGATSRAVFGQAMGLEYEDFIQTDAAINRGNSGGALVDARGRLIGINTAIVSSSGGNNGVGFAVPINLARSVMESIVEHGRVIRGFLGVHIQDMNPTVAGAFGVDEDSDGALVAEVTPRSPADRAGIKTGDVITGFDEREVRDSRHLKLLVSQTPPEKEVSVTLLRDGKPREVEVVVKELPEQEDLASRRPGDSRVGKDTGGLQGVVVSDITPQERQQLNIPRDVRGALVTDLDENSAAWDAGLRRGDVILEINRKPVEDAESAIEAVQNLEHAQILLRVWRDGGKLFLGVDETRNE
jgi:serine protease Do